jgi:hypothetical protein
LDRTANARDLPFDKLPAADQVFEIFYKHSLELTKCAYHAINRAYPIEARRDNPKVEYRYAEAHRSAKQHFNFHKKIVRDWIDTFVKAKKHREPYDSTGDRPTTELRNVLAGQLTMLHKRLTDYAPMLLPAEDVESFLRTLNSVFNGTQTALAGDLAYYEADPKLTEQDL